MSDGHGDGGGCGVDGHAICAEPVAGPSDAAIVAPAPAIVQVFKGIEINRAAILERARQRRPGDIDPSSA